MKNKEKTVTNIAKGLAVISVAGYTLIPKAACFKIQMLSGTLLGKVCIVGLMKTGIYVATALFAILAIYWNIKNRREQKVEYAG